MMQMLALLALLASPSLTIEDGDPPVPLATVYLDSEGHEVDPNEAPAYYVMEATCTYFASCSGAIKWTTAGAPFGCTPAGASCGGSCTMCAGPNASSGSFCTAGSPPCLIPKLPLMLECGAASGYGCTTTVMPGQPSSSNGCYCDTGNLISPGTRVCYVASCGD